MITQLQVPCTMCKEVQIIKVNLMDVERWKAGELIQRAMPYLNADQRELLISGTCSACFEKLFGKDEEE